MIESKIDQKINDKERMTEKMERRGKEEEDAVKILDDKTYLEKLIDREMVEKENEKIIRKNQSRQIGLKLLDPIQLYPQVN